MAICFFGDYDYSYPRERILKRGLEKNEVEVIECQLSDSRKLIGWKKILYLVPSYFNLWRKFRKIEEKDVVSIIVPRNNHLLLPLARYLARVANSKLIYDAFDPLYFTAEMKGKSKFKQKILFYIEKLSLTLPDYLLVETEGFADLYSETFSIPKEKFIIVPAGADEEIFYPQKNVKKRNKFTVLYWGGFHPHHGVETIIRAAEKLTDYDDIEFVLVGKGMEYQKMVSLSDELGLDNVVFKGRVSNSELVELIASSDVCLGIFSKYELALCSITNKVLEALAMKNAVITEKSPLIKIFSHRNNIYLVSPDSPEELAKAIMEVKRDSNLRIKISNNGYYFFKTHFSDEKLAKRLL